MPLAAVFLLLMIGGLGLVRVQLQLGREEIAKDLSAVATMKADQISSWRSDLYHDADVTLFPILHRDLVRFLTHNNGETRERILEQFHALARLHEYWDLQIVDSAGDIQLSLRDDGHYCDEYRDALMTSFDTGTPMMLDLHTTNSQDGVPPHVSTVTPIYSDITPPSAADTPLLGALVLLTKAESFFYPLLTSWPTSSETAETLLVQRDGADVLFLTELRHADAAPMTLRVPIDSSDFVGAMAVTGTTGFVRGTDYRGSAVVATVQPIPDSSWILISKQDTGEAFADVRRQITLLLLLLGGLLSVVVLAAVTVQQRSKKVHYRHLFRSEARLREIMERHSVTLRSIGDAVIAVDTHRRVEVLNPAAEVLTGWSHSEAIGRPIEDVFLILDAHSRMRIQDPVTDVLNTGETLGLVNGTLLISRNGEEFQIADSAAPIRDRRNATTGAVLVFRDVTEEYRIKHALKASETVYRDLIESTHAITWEFNLASDKWSYVAPQVTKVLGWTPEEWLGLSFWKENLHPDDRETAFGSCMTLTGRGENHELEYRFRCKNGEYVWIRDVISVETENDTPVKLRGVMIDISERKRAEHELQAAFEEKTQLLRELYHRTKNNMQVIISLLNLHATASGSTEVQDVLRDNAQRIQSMALVHEMLYRSQNLSRVNLAEYLEELVSLLVVTYNTNDRRIATELDLASLWVSIDTAIPCGMVANELISNAMKHAFAAEETGCIKVSLRTRGDTDSAVMEISDSGRGFPPGFDWRKSPTIGLQTTLSIVEDQLQGTISFATGTGLSTSPGTTCTIRCNHGDRPVRV